MIPKEVNIGICLARLTPGAEFTVDNTGKETVIKWRDKLVDQPTDAEIVAEWAEFLAEEEVKYNERADKMIARGAAFQRLKKIDLDKEIPLEEISQVVSDLIRITIG